MIAKDRVKNTILLTLFGIEVQTCIASTVITKIVFICLKVYDNIIYLTIIG